MSRSRMTKAELQAELDRMAAELERTRAAEGAELVNLSTRIPRRLRDRLKAHAAARGVSVREVIADAVAAHLDAAENEETPGPEATA